MKKVQFTIHIILLFAAVVLLTTSSMQAQDSKKEREAKNEAAIKMLIDSQRYVFKAQSVMPMSGRTRQLTSEYDLKVGKDTVEAYLPYFGRAYTAPMNPSDGGIRFVSKDFDYTAAPGKKQGWNITIKPKDAKDVQVMNLSVSSAGYATLQVTSTSKQPISFTGYITERKTKKKKG